MVLDACLHADARTQRVDDLTSAKSPERDDGLAPHDGVFIFEVADDGHAKPTLRIPLDRTGKPARGPNDARALGTFRARERAEDLVHRHQAELRYRLLCAITRDLVVAHDDGQETRELSAGRGVARIGETRVAFSRHRRRMTLLVARGQSFRAREACKLWCASQ